MLAASGTKVTSSGTSLHWDSTPSDARKALLLLPPSASDRGVGREGQGLMIGLTDELRACIDLAAGLHGVDSKTLVQMIIGETVATYIERGKQRREELRRLVEEGRQGL